MKRIVADFYANIFWGIKKKKRIKTYHDLDHLAGTWSEKDAKEFRERVADMEKIDEEPWK